MQTARILITDPIHSVCSELLEAAGYAPEIATGKSKEELVQLAPGADAWIVRSGTKVDKELIEAADQLRVIGRAGVGVDNVDLEAATHRGILVINAPEGNTISTAEHTVAMLLALSRKISAANSSLRGGAWARKDFVGTELYRKTLGVIGVGKIGKAVATRMKAFEMRVIGYDPILSDSMAEKLGIELVPLDQLIRESDFITVHTPINDATRGMLNDETLATCKKGVAIVNCARGGIVEEGALLRALESGQVSGAALDVYSSEPPPEGLTELINHPRVVATPHIAASTDEAQEKVARQVTEQIIHALRDEPVLTAVNAMAVRPAADPEVKPFLQLAEKLGCLAQQMAKGKVKQVKVGCRGDVPKRYTEVIEIAVLKGFLAPFFAPHPVNLVNAPVLAKERGLKSGVETHEVEHGFINRIDVELVGGEEPVKIAGSLFGDSEPRIVRIQGFHMDVRPEGSILLYRNIDKPGMLARVVSILADEGINIAALALGRSEPGAEALTAINVDQEIPADVILGIEKLEGVFAVQPIHL